VDISKQLELLTVVPTVGKVPGALWRLVDHPVAAATLQNACTGVMISGASQVVFDPQWTSGIPPVIPISSLIDESLAVPLGLNAPAGSLVPALAVRPAGRAPAASLQALGRRSSPPVLATLSAGMQQPLAPLPAGPSPADAPRPAAVPQPEPQPAAPMLRAVLRGPLPPVPAPAPAPATTAPAAVASLPRVSPPQRPRQPLHRTAPPRTRGPRRHLTSAPIVPREGGLDVAAGSLHVWDLPGGGAFTLSGSAAARAVFLDRAGAPLTDTEAVPGTGLRLDIPPAASRLVVSCLGTMPEELEIVPGPGAVALAAAARGQAAAAGWQDSALLARVAPAALLGRGASLRLGAPLRPRAGGPELVPATAALAGQTVSETTLPAAVDVVLVILDARGPALPSAGPRVLAAGATLAAPPLVVAGGRRLHLFYTVAERDEVLLRVTVASEAWQTAGVLGLRGRAGEWAQGLAAGSPRQLISDGPLTGAGSVTVVYQPTGEE
jgi:hypothetical protein